MWGRLSTCGRLAIGLFVCCLNLQAADPMEAVFNKAASALSAHDYAAAEQGFQTVLKAQPANIAALGNLGVVYARTNRPTQAITIYRRALRIAPGDKGLLTNLGLAYVKQEQFAEALPVFEKLAIDPANQQAHELLATCLLALGKTEPALKILEPLPANAGVLYMQGVAYVKLKRPEEANAAFAKMMETVGPAQANFLMGKANYETGRFDEAAANFRTVLKTDPTFNGAHRELGKTLLSLRDNDAAESELRTAGPDDPEALYFLGGLLAQSRCEQAIPILTKARGLNPDAWGPLYYLGRCYLEKGKLAKALPALEQAARLKPDEPAIQYQLGRAFQKAGKTTQAQAALVRVQELKAKTLKSELDILSPGRER